MKVRTENIRGRSSVWLERRPVTPEVASSSLVAPATIIEACHLESKVTGLFCFMVKQWRFSPARPPVPVLRLEEADIAIVVSSGIIDPIIVRV